VGAGARARSDYMKPFAPYIKEGCERIMKVHHRKIVGLFLHGEEQYGKAGVKSNRPERVGKVCTEMVKACPALPVKQLAVASDKDTCGACKSVVADALFLLKRDNIFASLAPKAFKKRCPPSLSPASPCAAHSRSRPCAAAAGAKPARSRAHAAARRRCARRTLELFDLLEPMCMDTYHRHADFPELHYAVCQEMWEEDDEGLMRALAAGGAGAARADAQRAVCAETFKYCKAGEISGEEEGGEL